MDNPLKSNLALLALSGVDILLRVFNQIQVANYFGTSAQRDVYFLANSVILFLFAIHFQSIGLPFLPRYILYLNQKHQKSIGHGFVWIYLVIIALLSVVLALLSSVFLSSGIFPFENVILISRILKILLVGFVFQTAVSMLTVMYHGEKQYILPAFLKISITLTIIFSIHFFHQKGIVVMAWGYLVGNAFCFLFLLFGRFQTFIQNLDINYHLKASQSFLKDIAPYILLAAIGKVVHLIEPLFVVGESIGKVSYLGYSYQIVLILLTLISASVVTTFYPKIAELDSMNDIVQLRKVVLRTIKITFIVCLGISGFILIYGNEIISVFFERGNFNKNDSFSIYKVLRWELIVFALGSLNLLFNRFFYLRNNKKILFQAAITSLVIYIIAAYFFHSILSYEGLGIALSIWSAVYFTVLITAITRELNIRRKKLALFFAKILFYILVAVFSLSLVNPFIVDSNDLTKVLIGGAIYGSILFFLFKYRKVLVKME